MKSFELVAELKRLLAGKRLDPEERELIMGPLELAEHVAHRRFHEGLELADRLMPGHPDPGLRYFRARCHMGLRDYERALADFERCVDVDGQNVSAWSGMGQCLMHLERYEEAEPHLRLASQERDDTHALTMLAYVVFKQGRDYEADELVTQGLQMAPGDRKLHDLRQLIRTAP